MCLLYPPFFMCVNIIYVCICLYCVICLILYYRSLLICTNKEFMNNMTNPQTIYYQLQSMKLNMHAFCKCTEKTTLRVLGENKNREN